MTDLSPPPKNNSAAAVDTYAIRHAQPTSPSRSAGTLPSRPGTAASVRSAQQLSRPGTANPALNRSASAAPSASAWQQRVRKGGVELSREVATNRKNPFYRVDWRILYENERAATAPLEAEHQELTRTVSTLMERIEEQQVRITELSHEHHRVIMGETVPSWVANQMDTALKAAEGERDSLRTERDDLFTQVEVLQSTSAKTEAALATSESRKEELRDETGNLRREIKRLRGEGASLRAMILEGLDDDDGGAGDLSALSLEEVRKRRDEAEARRLERLRDEEKHGASLSEDEKDGMVRLLGSFSFSCEVKEEDEDDDDDDEEDEKKKAKDGVTHRNVLYHDAQRRQRDKKTQDAEFAARSRAARAAISAASSGASPEEIVAAGKEAAADLNIKPPPKRFVTVDAVKREELAAVIGRLSKLRGTRDKLSVEEVSSHSSSAHTAAALIFHSFHSHHSLPSSSLPFPSLQVEEMTADAVERMDEALREGRDAGEAVTLALARDVDEAAVVAAAVQRVVLEHGDLATAEAVAAAADAACMLAGSGAAANVAVAAGERAAIGVVAREESLEEVHDEASAMANVLMER